MFSIEIIMDILKLLCLLNTSITNLENDDPNMTQSH